MRNPLPLNSRRMKENRRPDTMFEATRPLGSPTKANPYRHKNKYAGVQSKPSASLRVTEQEGRFEREFIEIEKIGSGEFGSAMKVRFKDFSRNDEVFAVKKSKRLEGSRHR